MILRRLAPAAVLLLALTGCAPDGTVVSRRILGNGWYQVCTQGEQGRGCEQVALDVYLACKVGDPWPECKPSIH